ncbi:hypothetical protein C8J57DRAFT_1504611 [Mycena rebaudengoi]|nr:hypothetical protein C8J57DRAFT_1504611 [Mycena rebaudengoi]
MESGGLYTIEQTRPDGEQHNAQCALVSLPTYIPRLHHSLCTRTHAAPPAVSTSRERDATHFLRRTRLHIGTSSHSYGSVSLLPSSSRPPDAVESYPATVAVSSHLHGSGATGWNDAASASPLPRGPAHTAHAAFVIPAIASPLRYYLAPARARFPRARRPSHQEQACISVSLLSFLSLVFVDPPRPHRHRTPSSRIEGSGNGNGNGCGNLVAERRRVRGVEAAGGWDAVVTVHYPTLSVDAAYGVGGGVGAQSMRAVQSSRFPAAFAVSSHLRGWNYRTGAGGGNGWENFVLQTLLVRGVDAVCKWDEIWTLPVGMASAG